MHIAASAPVCVDREDVDPEMIEQEREIFATQAKNEGKPEKIIGKIVDGKIEKYYSEIVLLEQPFVKDNDKTVAAYLQETIGSLGENIQIKRFSRFRLGE
jgi:elongation factor Ts